MRRSFFLISLIALSVLYSLEGFAESPERSRKLSFFNTHTKERITVIYKKDGEYFPQGIKEIEHIFRDHRRDEVGPLDPELLDFLYDLLTAVDNHGEVHIISAYRSEATNKMLRRRSSGVAKNSQHMRGTALDFRLPGTDTKYLRDTAWKMQRGGVGYYKSKDFIHIDTARVRWW